MRLSIAFYDEDVLAEGARRLGKVILETSWKSPQTGLIMGIDTLLADRDKEHREYVDLFRLSHSQLIDAKLRARKQLSWNI